MFSTYQSMSPQARARARFADFGMTAPGSIEAYVRRRVQDPLLLAEPTYADFFTPPTH